ncbi:hypothetical protein SGPA1_12600 [Streptomyces misionensis JCM 4497]
MVHRFLRERPPPPAARRAAGADSGPHLARAGVRPAEPADLGGAVHLDGDDGVAGRGPAGDLPRRPGAGGGPGRLPGLRRAGAGPGAGAAGRGRAGPGAAAGAQAGRAGLDGRGPQERRLLAEPAVHAGAVPLGAVLLHRGGDPLSARLEPADLPAVVLGLPDVRGAGRAPALRRRPPPDLPGQPVRDHRDHAGRTGLHAGHAVAGARPDHGGRAAGAGAARSVGAVGAGGGAGVGPGCRGGHGRRRPAPHRARSARRGAGPAGRSGHGPGAGEGEAAGGPAGGGPHGGGGPRRGEDRPPGAARPGPGHPPGRADRPGPGRGPVLGRLPLHRAGPGRGGPAVPPGAGHRGHRLLHRVRAAAEHLQAQPGPVRLGRRVAFGEPADAPGERRRRGRRGRRGRLGPRGAAGPAGRGGRRAAGRLPGGRSHPCDRGAALAWLTCGYSRPRQVIHRHGTLPAVSWNAGVP